jgi:hypothetical protein
MALSTISTLSSLINFKKLNESNNNIYLAFGRVNNTIGYSYDGITWVGLGNSIYTTYGQHAISNRSIVVSVGAGTNCIAYSYNGIDWVGLGNSIFSDWGHRIVWTSSLNRFVAVGRGGNSIAYSSDGINWIGRGAIFQEGRGVIQNL